MPRRGNVPKREILPDPMYGSVLVTKLVNSIMLDGKKGVAQKVVYGAFDIIKEKTEKEPPRYTGYPGRFRPYAGSFQVRCQASQAEISDRPRAIKKRFAEKVLYLYTSLAGRTTAGRGC